jgi:L-gulonate 5-dehydrogenase
MKALVYTDPETLPYQDVPKPKPAKGEVLVKARASGICGPDMHAFHGHDQRRNAQMILGHEASGLVVGGPEDERRVTLHPLVIYGKCRV